MTIQAPAFSSDLAHEDPLAVSTMLELMNTQRLDAVVVQSVRDVIARAPGRIREFLAHPQTDRDSAIPVLLTPPPQALLLDDPEEQQRADSRAESSRQAWCELVELLVGAGLDPTRLPHEKWTIAVLRSPVDAQTVEFIMDKGSLNAQTLSVFRERGDVVHASGLLHTLVACPQKQRVKLLKKLRVVGVVGGALPILGATDLLCAGLREEARSLIEQGEPLEACRTSLHNNLHGWSPIEAFLGSLHLQIGPLLHVEGPVTDPKVHATKRKNQAKDAVRGLQLLVQWGAWQSPRPPDMESSSLALSLLLGGPNSLYPSRWSRETLTLVGAELLALGADPNDGHALAACLATMMRLETENEEPYDTAFAMKWATECGLDWSQHASAVHVVAASHYDATQGWAAAQRFVALGASIDSIQPTQYSPVQCSFEQEKMENAWRFVNAGAPLDYVDAQGECVLHLWADRAGKSALAQLDRCLARPEVLPLLSQGCTREGHEGEQPLHRACAALNLKVIEKLLKAGAPINAQDALGWTPLRHALRKSGAKAQEKAVPVLHYLLEHGADPSICDNKGRTPAQSAAGQAPLIALAGLLKLRPQDVGSGSNGAATTQAKLRRRGVQGLALAERGELDHALAQSAKKRDSIEVTAPDSRIRASATPTGASNTDSASRRSRRRL